MNWIKIDLENLPTGIVLAANFKEDTFGYKDKMIGYIYLYDDGLLCCESDREVLENVTHYIDINKFDL